MLDVHRTSEGLSIHFTVALLKTEWKKKSELQQISINLKNYFFSIFLTSEVSFPVSQEATSHVVGDSLLVLCALLAASSTWRWPCPSKASVPWEEQRMGRTGANWWEWSGSGKTKWRVSNARQNTDRGAEAVELHRFALLHPNPSLL